MLTYIFYFWMFGVFFIYCLHTTRALLQRDPNLFNDFSSLFALIGSLVITPLFWWVPASFIKKLEDKTYGK